MTIQECYAGMHGDYASAKKRLMNDRLVEKFMLKFPADPTMQQLREAVMANLIAESFRAAHTLKGLAANLSFTELQEAAAALTEQLRSQRAMADPNLFHRVEQCYRLVVDTLDLYTREHA